MEPLSTDINIKKTDECPSVHFDSFRSILRIEGRSLMEDPYEFYGDLIEWMKVYVENMTAPVTIEINLDYFNSSSGRYLLEFLLIADTRDSLFSLIWLAEENDEVMIEKGMEINYILNMSVKNKIYS